MEPVIAVLPPHVVDQIAAGEVIERPASVVKELVDNAIDAGARTISVEAVAGGRSLIRVTDDGCGMSPDSARLAFERHATSKLRVVDDLWELSSMGFRGEALPSIASVSRMTLTTRRAGDVAATRITWQHGKLVEIAEVGAAVGTTVEVADLLANLPARLKFLKGEATEASHVTDQVARIAMAFPQLHFRLRHNGRTALELPVDRDGLGRAQALLGSRIAARMVPVAGEEGGVRVVAYLGAPDLAQTTARGVQLFVGRRPVRDRGLLHAVTMGYGELVARGRYPIAVVLLDLAAGTVDVNVHPQKQEVRFRDAAAVAAAVRHVVQTGVGAAPWRAESGGAVPVSLIASVAPPALPFDGAAATPLAQRYARELRARQGAGQASLAFVAREPDPRSWAADVRSAPDARMRREQQERSAVDRALAQAARDAAVPDPADGGEAGRIAAQVAHEVAPSGSGSASASGDARAPDACGEPTGYFAALRYLGQLDLTYLVCEAAGELVLVDQHAAHERVELARLVARHRAERAAPTQKLLFPITTAATPAQLAQVATAGPLLAQVGYEAEPFGGATLAIKAVPAGLRHADPAQLLARLLDTWATDGAPSEAERLLRVLGEIACHSVVRAGDRLAPDEAESLLRSLDAIDPAAPAPHGRALLLRLPIAELGRRFGR